MSINKTPTGKTVKGQVSVRLDTNRNGSTVKACFPRNFFANGRQVKKATGINPNDWQTIATKLQRRLQIDLEEGKLDDGSGNFNELRYQQILMEYGLRASLRIAPTKRPHEVPDTLKIWNKYCEYKKISFRESTFQNAIKGTLQRFLESAIAAVGEDSIAIRNWLLMNRNHDTVKKLLSHLESAYDLAIRQGEVEKNPFLGFAEDLAMKGNQGKTQQDISTEEDSDILDQSKAYTWEQALVILEHVKTTATIKHWYNFLAFKFLTGCRTGEAIALMWKDVLWDKQQVLFRRTYDRRTNRFYNVKTAKGDKELVRIFPMSKDSELWNLLKSIPQGESSDIVFTSKQGKIINISNLARLWKGDNKQGCKGIIPPLLKQGKLTKYLPLYNTRHTFINHQIFDLGRDEKIVSAWCGHSESISQRHYQDISSRAALVNPDTFATPLQDDKDALLKEIDRLKAMLKEKE